MTIDRVWVEYYTRIIKKNLYPEFIFVWTSSIIYVLIPCGYLSTNIILSTILVKINLSIENYHMILNF